MLSVTYFKLHNDNYCKYESLQENIRANAWHAVNRQRDASARATRQRMKKGKKGEEGLGREGGREEEKEGGKERKEGNERGREGRREVEREEAKMREKRKDPEGGR